MKLTKTFIRFFKTDANGEERTAEYLVDNREIYNLVNPDGSANGFYFFDVEVDSEDVLIDEQNRFQANKPLDPLNASGRYYFNGQVYSREELGDVKDIITDELYDKLMALDFKHYVRMMNGMWQEFEICKDKVIPNALFDTHILDLKAGFTDPLDSISGSILGVEVERG